MERKTPVTLPDSGPLISPGVTDPRALSYAAGVAARRGGVEAPKYTAPPGGGGVPIPRLDQPHQQNITMADQARSQRLPVPHIPGGIIQPPTAPVAAPPPMGPPPLPNPMAGLLSTDMLPEVATHDPMFKSGMGSMSATVQPGLAFKYGVIRNGQHIPPQKLSTGRAGLSKETVESLNAVAAFNKQRPEIEDPVSAADAKIEKEASAKADQLLDDVKALRPKDNLDFNRIKEMQNQELLNNEDQRQIVEGRLQPMDLAKLVMSDRIQQVVPISPGVLEPTFQSMTWDEETTLKRMILEEAKQLELTDQYLLDRYSLMGLTVGLYALNGTVLPTHLNNEIEKKFDTDAFWKKFDTIKRMPFHLTASLAINFFWFEIRVRKLFVMERVKNG